MKKRFKVGDEVVLVKNLGPQAGGYANEYYYHARLQNVPLNSVGKIVEIADKATYYVELNNGFGLDVHPKEIKLFESVDKSVGNKFAKKLSRHPLFEFAEDSPVFLVENNVYSITDQKAGDYFSIKGKKGRKQKKQSISLAGEASMLDSLFFGRNELHAKDFQKNYVEEIIKTKFDGVLAGELNIPQIIYKQIFPYLRSVDYEGRLKKELVKAKKRKPDLFAETAGNKGNSKINYENHKNQLQKNPAPNKQDLDKFVNTIKKNLEEFIVQIEKENENRVHVQKSRYDEALAELLVGKPAEKKYNSLADKMAGGKNLAFVNGAVYELVESPSKNSSCAVIDGKKFYLKETGKKTSEIEQMYLRDYCKKTKISALRKYFTDEKIKDLLEKEQGELAMIAGLKEYSEQDFGFIEHRGIYYVYIDVPAFAIKDPVDKKYYLLDKSRVAFSIFKNTVTGKIQEQGYPFQIDNNGHPLLKGHKNDFVGLCAGRNYIPRGKTIWETFALRLRRYREILMYGYADAQISYYSTVGKIHEASLSELEKKGVVILDKGKKRLSNGR